MRKVMRDTHQFRVLTVRDRLPADRTIAYRIGGCPFLVLRAALSVKCL